MRLNTLLLSVIRRHLPGKLLIRAIKELDRDVECETCKRCGIAHGEVFHVEDATWDGIAPYPDGGGVLCMRCTELLSKKCGLPLYWYATADGKKWDRMVRRERKQADRPVPGGEE